MLIPRIYVVCLASSDNARNLYGKWINATQNIDVIKSKIEEMLKYSEVYGAETWEIHDYEDFEEAGSYFGQSPCLEDVVEVAELLTKHGAIVAKLVEHYGGDIEDVKRTLEEDYRGCYNSLGDYAKQFCRLSYQIPSWLEFYINWQKMAEDWQSSRDIFSIETGFEEIHVFVNR